MSKHPPLLTQSEVSSARFDFYNVVDISPGTEPGDSSGWQVLARGSDAHIVFLEHALRDLQATLVELKAQRSEKFK